FRRVLFRSYGWDVHVDFDRHAIAEKQSMIIPNDRRYYLRDISQHVRNYKKKVEEQSKIATKLYQIEGTKETIDDETTTQLLDETKEKFEQQLDPESKQLLNAWDEMKEKYAQDSMTFSVRDKEISVDLTSESLAGL